MIQWTSGGNSVGTLGCKKVNLGSSHVALFIFSTAAVGLKPGGYCMYQKV